MLFYLLAAEGGGGSSTSTTATTTSGYAAKGIIKGGGDNIFKQAGQEAKADSNTPQKKISNEEEVDERSKRAEQAKLEQVKQDLDKQISADAALDKFKNQIFMDITTDGLRIQIVDEKNRPMFDSGSADMAPQTRQLLNTIGKVLSGLDNRLRIEGHTDSRRFGGGPAGYGNWELSSERANAARRAIVGGGLDESRIAFVAGFADSIQLNPADATDPLNRRISLMVLKPPPGIKRLGAPPIKAEAGGAAASAAANAAASAARAAPAFQAPRMASVPAPAQPAQPAQSSQSSRETAATARPYSAGLSQQAGSGGAPAVPEGAALFPPPPAGMAREAPPPPMAPVPDATSNRGQVFVLPGRK